MMYQVIRESNDYWSYEVYGSYSSREEAITVANRLNKDIDVSKYYDYKVVVEKK